MQHLLLLILFFSFQIKITAQSEVIELLDFKSDKEASLYKALINDNEKQEISSTEYFTHFMLTNSDDIEGANKLIAKTRIIADELQSQRKYNKSADKKIELIHQKAHQEIFKKYISEATPELLNETGEYNCVTGTAYYFLLASMLNIPCHIHEEPQHVYPSLAFSDVKVAIESTNPITGYNKYPTSFKNQTIQNLINSKLIDIREYENLSNEEIFAKIYEDEREISMEELIAIQYFNQSIFQLFGNKRNSYEAAMHAAKAYFISPTLRHEVGLISTISNFFTEQIITPPSASQSTILQAENLLKIITHVELDSIKTYLPVSLHRTFCEVTVLKNSFINDFRRTSRYMINHQKSLPLRKEIEHTYHIFEANYLNTKGEFEDALPHLESALKNYPDDLSIINSYTATFNQFLSRNLDNDSLLEAFSNKHLEYPALKENYAYREFVAIMFYNRVINEIVKGSTKGITNQIRKLESLESFFLDIYLSQQLGQLYRDAAVIFFEKNMLNSAKKYIKKAIHTYPENSDYRRLQAVFNY